MSPERRRVPRISSLLTLRYRLSIAGKPLSPMSLTIGKPINLSKAGIRFDAKDRLVTGDCLELEIDFSRVPQFGHAGSPLIVTGTVTRATKLITNRGTQYQIAVEFHDVTPKDMVILEEYLAAHAGREENAPEIEQAPLTTPLLQNTNDP